MTSDNLIRRFLFFSIKIYFPKGLLIDNAIFADPANVSIVSSSFNNGATDIF